MLPASPPQGSYFPLNASRDREATTLASPLQYQWCSSQPAALHRDTNTGSTEHRHIPVFQQLKAFWEGFAVPGNVSLPHAHASLDRAASPIPQMIHQEPHGESSVLLSYPKSPWASWTPERSFCTDCACRTCAAGVGEHFVHRSMKCLRCRGCTCSGGSQCHTHWVPLSLLLAPHSPLATLLFSRKVFLLQDTSFSDFECCEIPTCTILPCMISQYITCYNTYLIQFLAH